ncbi:hypothetical protein N9757_00995 [Flavobacteriaceae bacterium]|nr:hypothetical protein [Flavobacteriaceae bacterium]
MIRNRKDLKFYLHEDAHRAGLTSKFIYMAKLLYGNEQAHALRYLKLLRHYEYHYNCRHKLISLWFRFRHSRMGLRYGIHIGPNCVGYGFWIPHFVGGIIIGCKSMGNYCSANGGVIVGNKDNNENIPTIGDYVSLQIGCKVYGKVTLGDNVIVAPNSVVYKDLPSNVAASGVPAKIIKTNLPIQKVYYFDKE